MFHPKTKKKEKEKKLAAPAKTLEAEAEPLPVPCRLASSLIHIPIIPHHPSSPFEAFPHLFPPPPPPPPAAPSSPVQTTPLPPAAPKLSSILQFFFFCALRLCFTNNNTLTLSWCQKKSHPLAYLLRAAYIHTYIHTS